MPTTALGTSNSATNKTRKILAVLHILDLQVARVRDGERQKTNLSGGSEQR